MKTLCVLTNMFPYGTGEAYLESEVTHYSGYDNTFICSLMLKDDAAKTKRDLPEGMEVIPVRFASRLVYLIWSIFVLFDSEFYKELSRLMHDKRFSLSRLVRLFVYISRSHYESNVIYRKIGDALKQSDELVFYSYRFEYQPYVAVLLRKKIKNKNCVIVSRAHRYDLYEERNNDKYIPLRKCLLEELEFVYPCSRHGERYLQSKFPEYASKIKARYLGTMDYGLEKDNSGENCLRFVSCSNVTPVKRLDKIVDVFKNIPEIKIKWTHFGDGEEMAWLKGAVRTLPDNIEADLRGAVTNKVVLIEYADSYIDLFINLSDSEGLPVSIMESMSFGIPCIATDVGGVSELVIDGKNGLLVSADDSCELIAEKIVKVLPNLGVMRKEARKSWENQFNADENYFRFNDELNDLVAL